MEPCGKQTAKSEQCLC